MNRHVFMQSAKQVFGLMRMAVQYNNVLPDEKTGASKIFYRLPFEGAYTTFNGGIDEQTSHSWDVYTQRYGYDFVMTDERISSLKEGGNAAILADYHCYGAHVLAPAAGIVAEVHDGEPDTPPAPDGAIRSAARDIRGNYVLIDHENGEFSCLAHFKPATFAVRAGQRVEAGQLLGLCGSSGNSSEPHVHFHVQAGRSFYTSPGMPIRFDGVRMESIEGWAALDTRPQPENPAATYPPFLTRGTRVEHVGPAKN